MKTTIRLALLLICLMMFLAKSFGSGGSIRLTAYPPIALADNKSIVNITVEARDSDGKLVPDGTKVTLVTTLGQLRESVVRTQSGIARTELIASGIPGVAKVTATIFGIDSLGAINIEFTEDPSALGAKLEYIDIIGKDYLAYFIDLKWVAASGKDKNAVVKYRDITIKADDLQMDVSGETVIARNATLKVGKKILDCDELNYNIRRRYGSAVTEFEGKSQIVELTVAEVTGIPERMDPNLFRFKDNLDTSEAYVLSDSLTINADRELQFRDAKIYVADKKVLSLPLYSLDIYGGGGNLFGSDIIGWNDGKFSLNVPYFYSLSPRSTGVIRMSTQQRSDRGSSASHGLFFDIEQTYRGASGYEGQFAFTDVAGKVWGANWRHSQRFNKDTQGYFAVDSPDHDVVFAYSNLNKQLGGFHLGINSSYQTQISDFSSNSQRYDVNLETSQWKIKNTPLRTSIGVATSYNATNNSLGYSDESKVGLRWRTTLQTVPLTKQSNLVGGLSVSYVAVGKREGEYDVLGSLSADGRFGKNLAVNLVYDYSQVGSESNLLGNHRLSAQMQAKLGSVNMRVAGATGLDVDYRSVFADMSWQMGPLFRLGASYTLQSSPTSEYDDMGLIIAYRLGYREIGLMWTEKTKRISFELLSTSF